MASNDGTTALRANREIQCSLGAKNVLLSPEEITQHFPWMSSRGVTLGCLGLSGEGWFDPHSLLNLYISEAKGHGVEVDYAAAKVSSLELPDGEVRAVYLTDRRKISCGCA